MARIRSLKPEFFLSEKVASISLGARLFFAGLWTVADREGRLRWQPRKLKAQLFPYDAIDLYPLAEELVSVKLLLFYADEDGVYAWLPGFPEHQRPHPKEPTSAIPPYPSGMLPGWLPWRKTADSRESPGSIPSSPVGMDLDLGREGKGADEPPSPAVAARGSLIGRGENVHFDQQQRREHEKHHPEVCAWRNPAVRVCMPAGQVAQLADKLLGVPVAERVPQVIAWAQAHVPTVAELPANLFRYWDAQWDARQRPVDEPVPDGGLQRLLSRPVPTGPGDASALRAGRDEARQTPRRPS